MRSKVRTKSMKFEQLCLWVNSKKCICIVSGLLAVACCLRPSAFLFLMILQYCFQRVQTWIANTGKVAGPHRVMGPPLNQSISSRCISDLNFTAVHLHKGIIPFSFFLIFFFISFLDDALFGPYLMLRYCEKKNNSS